MNAMVTTRRRVADSNSLNPRPFSAGLGFVELVDSASRRHSRIEDIAAEIDRASEFEALRHRGWFLRPRDTWNRPS